MVTNMQNILRSLCFNTEWKYAVFWKLKHRARMVLTWEDAYYDNYEQLDPSENKCFGETQEHIHGGHLSHNPLGQAVAKMSYHVYSLGEGIVGKVAVTGKHQWIFADKHLFNSVSSFEFSDGWQSQFSAGIKTIVVVAVVPYGVVQLGSLNKVVEDITLVARIKNAFLALQDSLVASTLQNHMRSSLFEKTAAEVVNKNGEVAVFTEGNDESFKSLQQRSNVSCLEDQNEIRMKLISDQIYGGMNSVLGRVSEHNLTHYLNNFVKDNIIPTEKSGADLANLPTNHFTNVCNRMKSDSTNMYLNGVMSAPETSETILRRDLDEKSNDLSELSHCSSSNTFCKFSAGSELHEALGPAFFKSCMYADHEEEKTGAANAVEMLEEMSSSQMTFENGSENLLEAVVASVFHGGTEIKSEKFICKSVQSVLTTEKMPEPSSQTKYLIDSACYSTNKISTVEEDTQNGSNSTEVCGAMSSRGYSFTCASTCSEPLDRRSETSKNNKKRAKPGENSRPRPRDRQMIQDRIKELRDLVPNGSKCSIDSLLERTIKYMLFLESITKHAEKLNKCEPKMHQKGAETSNYEQGSSWAVEVGGHLKVSSIIVENLNKNGQMLVEMLCEECSHFLEIADAIRNLGLTILKGITEAHGEKTWICFVVEGHNNKIMHRMDILWSLVQTLQPKSTN